jgi:hypothetical protein
LIGLPPLASSEKRNILKGAVFTYSLKNWFNEHWKQWDDDDDDDDDDVNQCDSNEANVDMHGSEENEDRNDSIAQARTTHLASFTDHILRTNADWNDTTPLPTLPFGPYNDPLRTMTLSAVFPLSNSNYSQRYTDDAIHSNMDALTAEFWELTCEFAPSSQQRAFLSTLLDRAISSWVKDPSNQDYLAPYDSNNNGDDGVDSGGGSTGLVRNLLHAMSTNRGPIYHENQIAVVKSDQVETIMHALFKSPEENWPTMEGTSPSDYIKVRRANSDLSVFTPWALGLRLKHGASVPWRSFLWNLVVYQLDALQVAGTMSTSSSYMGFLRVLWIEIMRQIRWHWENLIPIPNVDPYLYRQFPTREKVRSSSTQGSQRGSTIGIDLSYNIVSKENS